MCCVWREVSELFSLLVWVRANGARSSWPMAPLFISNFNFSLSPKYGFFHFIIFLKLFSWTFSPHHVLQCDTGSKRWPPLSLWLSEECRRLSGQGWEHCFFLASNFHYIPAQFAQPAQQDEGWKSSVHSSVFLPTEVEDNDKRWGEWHNFRVKRDEGWLAHFRVLVVTQSADTSKNGKWNPLKHGGKNQPFVHTSTHI